jgi:hypothetical protein
VIIAYLFVNLADNGSICLEFHRKFINGYVNVNNSDFWHIVPVGIALLPATENLPPPQSDALSLSYRQDKFNRHKS